MREISLDQPPDVMPVNTFLIYGDSRSGKTTFAASFPRPLFLSDVTEGGWDSIANMADEQFFEPGRKPLVWGIEKMSDMAEARVKAQPLIQSGAVKTIVVDSISFYCDLYLNSLLGMQTKKDTRAAYGDLGNHLRDLRVQMHSLGVNVVWLGLAKHPDADYPIGGPMIPGQQGDKFMAGCHYVFFARSYQERKGQDVLPAVYEMRTRRYLGYVAGNRLGGRANDLPDPLVGDYVTFLEHLGYDYQAILANIHKPIAAPKPVIVAPKPTPVATPAPVATPKLAPATPAPVAVVKPAATPAAKPAVSPTVVRR